MATRTPASGFPVAFTAADEATIDSLFPAWLRTPGNATPNLAGYMRVLSNKATNKFGLPSECGYRIDGTFANDQYAGGVISGLAGTFEELAFRVRSSADVDAGRDEYRLRIRDTSPKQTYVEYVLNGSVSSTLGSYTDIAWASGDTPVIEVEGTDIRVYNGTTLLKTLTGAATALTAGNPGWSLIAGSGNIVQIDDLVVGDLTAPAAAILSSPTATSPTTTTVTAGCTTDTPSGTLYQLARIGGSAASAATIIATGQSMAVSTTTPSRSYTGLTAGTTGYVIDMVQVVSAVNSNVVSSAAFNTAAGTTPVAFTGSVPAQSGTVGTAYTTLALAPYFSGTQTPFAYTVFSGSLPPGLSLNSSTGQITGTPTTAGSYSAVVRATDSSTNVANTGTIAWTVLAAIATTFSFTASGAVSLTGLDYAVFETTRVSTMVAPIKKGTDATVSAGSVCSISVVGLTTKRVGEKGMALLTNADGTDSGGSQAATRRLAYHIGSFS